MEGLTLGLEQPGGQVWSLFIAVALRQLLLTFSVCLELQESRVRPPVFLAQLSVLSLATSLGTALGLILTEAGAELQQIPLAAVWGLAGGAVLYTVLSRVTARRMRRTKSGLVQVGGLGLGFILVLLTEIFGHHIRSRRYQKRSGMGCFLRPTSSS